MRMYIYAYLCMYISICVSACAYRNISLSFSITRLAFLMCMCAMCLLHLNGMNFMQLFADIIIIIKNRHHCHHHFPDCFAFHNIMVIKRMNTLFKCGCSFSFCIFLSASFIAYLHWGNEDISVNILCLQFCPWLRLLLFICLFSFLIVGSFYPNFFS